MNLALLSNSMKGKFSKKIPQNFSPKRIIKRILLGVIILVILAVSLGAVYMWKFNEPAENLPIDIPKVDEVPNLIKNSGETSKSDSNKNNSKNNVKVAMVAEKPSMEIPVNPFISSKQLSALAEEERVKEAEMNLPSPTVRFKLSMISFVVSFSSST